jgi:hypothetical protein
LQDRKDLRAERHGPSRGTVRGRIPVLQKHFLDRACCSCAAAAGAAAVTSSPDMQAVAEARDASTTTGRRAASARSGVGGRPTVQVPACGKQEAPSGKRVEGIEAAAAEI